jgi:hypothetical protein
MNVSIVFFLATSAFAQSHGPSNEDKAKEQKKNGQWQFLQAQSTRLAPERNAINLDPKLLDSFLGKYQFGPNAIATITREGDALKWRRGNRMPVTLVPLSETHFFSKETETEMMFLKNENGQVTDVVMRVGTCQDSKAKKIE